VVVMMPAAEPQRAMVVRMRVLVTAVLVTVVRVRMRVGIGVAHRTGIYGAATDERAREPAPTLVS
jgi:hypothetical protein